MGLAADLALGLNAAAWAERITGYEMDPWQAEVLRSGAERVLMNCCRQSGKSLVAALLALHTAIYKPGSLTLLLSPSLRQSQELFKKVAGLYREVAEAVPAEAESALRVELTNGSRIISLPGREQSVRGYSAVDLLVVDEAARVSDDLYYSIRPMLAVSGGRLVLLSTPYGKRGVFWQTWSDNGDGWLLLRATAEDCPRISGEFLAEERAALGDWWFAQEYEAAFQDAQTAAFTWEMVQSATLEEVDTWAL